jgi:hypothetical protein
MDVCQWQSLVLGLKKRRTVAHVARTRAWASEEVGAAGGNEAREGAGVRGGDP